MAIKRLVGYTGGKKAGRLASDFKRGVKMSVRRAFADVRAQHKRWANGSGSFDKDYQPTGRIDRLHIQGSPLMESVYRQAYLWPRFTGWASGTFHGLGKVMIAIKDLARHYADFYAQFGIWAIMSRLGTTQSFGAEMRKTLYAFCSYPDQIDWYGSRDMIYGQLERWAKGTLNDQREWYSLNGKSTNKQVERPTKETCDDQGKWYRTGL